MIFSFCNPYAGQNFFGFFYTACLRLFLWLCGKQIDGLASDEIQCLTLIFLGVSLSFLGSFLVVKKMTMLANALSHTLLVGIVLAFIFMQYVLRISIFDDPFTSMKILWIGAILTSVITTLCTGVFIRFFRVQEDASIGLVFTTLFALGVFLVTLFTKNVHIGVEALMGSIDALHIHDFHNVLVYALITVVFYFLLYRGFWTVAFDPLFAKTIGFPIRGLDFLLMIFTAGGAIGAFRAVGVLLFLALLVGPVLMMQLYTCRLKWIILGSFVIISGVSVVSVALSRHILTVWNIPLSTSGIIVSLLFLLYVIALLSVRNKLTYRVF